MDSNSHREFSGWKNGRFASKTVFKTKNKRSNLLKEKWRLPREEKQEALNQQVIGSLPNKINTTKRRVAEFSQLARDLWCKACDTPVSLRNFHSETQHGLAFDMRVRCQSCEQLISVFTDKPSCTSQSLTFDVNKKMAIGIIDSGSGTGPLNNILSALNVPPVSSDLVKRHERYVAPSFQQAADASCMKAILEEKQLSTEASYSILPVLEESHFDVSGGPNFKENLEPTPVATSSPTPDKATYKTDLTASVDAGWQKRGTQKNYNSLSGHASLIGRESGRVLAYGVASMRCILCEKGHPPDDHSCCRNHVGSAKAMEPALAVKMITQNDQLAQAQCVITTLVGDDDSSTIQAVRRESEVPVQKWADINHVEKSFTTALYNLKVSDAVRNYLRACFGAALHRNKHNSDGLKKDLANIVNHSYGEHVNCGAWCRYHLDPHNYRHTGLPGGKDLTCLEFKASLAKILTRFINNSEKIAPLGSSQSNENFNQLVSMKHPKSRSYAGSSSLTMRVQAAVCHKNEGSSYITEVAKLAHVSPGKETTKYRGRLDERRRKRSHKQKTVQMKRRRLVNKKNRSRRSAYQERREGITYETECGLDGIADLVDDPTVASRLPVDSEAVNVFFDLETTGLSKNTCEILQIAARCGEAVFGKYILPRKGISKGASAVTGLTTSAGQLFKNGELLQTTPPQKAFADFVAFLRSVGDHVVLVAHNGNSYDAPIILREARKYGLMEELLTVVGGFVDTLEVMKAHLPTRKESFKLSSLASLYNVNADDAHDARADVKIMLQEIVSASGVTSALLLRHSKTVSAIVRNEERLAKRSLFESSLKVLKPLVTANMIKKIANAGISLSVLQEAYRTSSDRGVELLLGESVNNRARVTKVKSKVSDIITALKATL